MVTYDDFKVVSEIRLDFRYLCVNQLQGFELIKIQQCWNVTKYIYSSPVIIYCSEVFYWCDLVFC